MDIQYDKVGRRIKRLRQKQRIKQADLADKAGVSHTYMSEIERGQARVGLEILVNISETLSVSLDYLVGKKSPDVVLRYGKEIADLVEDCTPAERKYYLAVLKEIKKKHRDYEGSDK
ncbi:MAG: helix-turn-helix transcriptional regulator [Butyrivibrio sp.]|uniref:helix-turn-helix domain-containing protein n=1 Tax=Butyrivibrio sp. TaxID=28121 RepID=UPI001B0B621B|nr:helix-turn-helix transcriptional regulator [Butyrivibrio sp.]MBO6241953.1 helix-turn-helix transcriptional regulator [Butyrivibrio sp.]